MNILPLILALALMLSILTLEKIEKFKNQTAVQREYQLILKQGEKQVFNQRQKNLFGDNEKSLRQLSFRFLIDKSAREGKEKEAKQIRMLIMELMKIVYGEAAFFKNLEKKRSNFLEELLNAIEQAADKAPKKTIRRVQDIAKLNLEDLELQKALYLMLKGSISRDRLKDIKDQSITVKEKAYVSLFTFIHDGGTDRGIKIVIQRAPKEILKAVFVNDEVVEAIMTRRNELAASKDNGLSAIFKSEFNDKRRAGLDDSMLDFSISESRKEDYN